MDSIDFTVIGSGICGVLTARAIKLKHPEADVVVIDKEPYPGHHNTTRNSGVLHAGIYYPTGSLKHRLCIQGHSQWIKWADEFDLPLNLCGKFVIATQESEIPSLEKYYQNALQNGVEGLTRLTPEDMDEIRDYTNVVAGFFSKRTGILDISSAINFFHRELEKMEVIVLMEREVTKLQAREEGIVVTTGTEEYLSKHLVNCGGPWAIELRKQLGLTNFENKFVKGNYLKLNKSFYNKSLIYPVPQEGLKGLGVHTSFHLDGIIRFGPNTEDVDGVDYMNKPDNIDIMYPAISAVFKGIEKSDLEEDYVGVRTKLLRNGELHTDFVVQGPEETGLNHYYECLGIESPGMTAAPAVAELLAEKITN